MMHTSVRFIVLICFIGLYPLYSARFGVISATVPRMRRLIRFIEWANIYDCAVIHYRFLASPSLGSNNALRNKIARFNFKRAPVQYFIQTTRMAWMKRTCKQTCGLCPSDSAVNARRKQQGKTLERALRFGLGWARDQAKVDK